MNRTEYLLTQATSECCEVAHSVTKAMHFGLADSKPGQHLTNADRIIEEWADLMGVMKMLCDDGILTLPENFDSMVAAKRQRVEKFMSFARMNCGTLRDDDPADLSQVSDERTHSGALLPSSHQVGDSVKVMGAGFAISDEHARAILEYVFDEAPPPKSDEARDTSMDRLHADIMNLPCDGATLDWANTREAYQYGHRDARHAAAELVAALECPCTKSA